MEYRRNWISQCEAHVKRVVAWPSAGGTLEGLQSAFPCARTTCTHETEPKRGGGDLITIGLTVRQPPHMDHGCGSTDIVTGLLLFTVYAQDGDGEGSTSGGVDLQDAWSKLIEIEKRDPPPGLHTLSNPEYWLVVL